MNQVEVLVRLVVQELDPGDAVDAVNTLLDEGVLQDAITDYLKDTRGSGHVVSATIVDERGPGT